MPCRTEMGRHICLGKENKSADYLAISLSGALFAGALGLSRRARIP
jgi:hypothetical protein